MNNREWDNVKEIILFVVWAFTFNSTNLLPIHVCVGFALLIEYDFKSILIKICALVEAINGISVIIKLYNNTKQ